VTRRVNDDRSIRFSHCRDGGSDRTPQSNRREAGDLVTESDQPSSCAVSEPLSKPIGRASARDVLIAARAVIGEQTDAVQTVARLGVAMIESGRPHLAALCLRWLAGEHVPEIDEADDVRH
jgi:hypothetical protein